MHSLDGLQVSAVASTAAREAEQLQGQRALLGLAEQRHRTRCRRRHAGPPEDGADAGVRVLQVGPGVALEGQHPVPVEDVVAHALGGQVGVLDRADAERVGDGGLALGRQVARALLHGRRGPVDPLGQQVDEALGPAAAAGQLLAVGPEDEAERDVDGLVVVGQVAGQRGHGEDQAQVQGLLGPDDVDEPGGAEAAGAVAHGGQVGRRVAVAAVGLAHDERERLAVAVLEALGEHAEGAVVLDQQALLVELGDDDGQQRVVEALPHDVVGGQEDAEQVVDLAGVAHATRRRRCATGAASRRRRSGAARRGAGSARRSRGRCRTAGGPRRRTR